MAVLQECNAMIHMTCDD